MRHTQRDKPVLSPSKSLKYASPSVCHKDSDGEPKQLSYDDMVTYDNLRTAYFQTIQGKQHRYRVQNFKRNFVSELKQLYKELKTRSYRVSAPRTFNIWCTAGQKVRRISAPTFRDLVVQRLIYNYVYYTFDKGFIFDSYGCRKNKGAERAADRTQDFIRHSPEDSYYLQIDIRRYYYNIRKDVLRQSLERKIQDQEIVNLLLMFMHDVGVDVGSIVAQLFGLIYLDRFDHYIKRNLKIKHYIRYVDDMVFIGLSQQECYFLLNLCIGFLNDNLGLTLSKWRIQSLHRSINFCGYRTNRYYRLIRKRSLKTFNRALAHQDYAAIESVLAHTEHSASYNFLMKKLQPLFNFLPKHLKRRIYKWQSIHSSLPKGHTDTG